MAGEHFGPARVRAVREVARDVRLVELEPEQGAEPYPTGSHIDLSVTIAGLPDTRSYSLVGERPADGAYRIAVKRLPESRGGSEHIHTLAVGDTLAVSAPVSHFELAHGRQEYLLVAGGIGITPMLGMAEALTRHGRPFRLLYAARERDDLAFLDELAELLGDRLRTFVSAEGERLDLAAEIDRLHPDGELYLCGPVRLRDAAQEAWRVSGRPSDRLRYETFGSGGRFAPEPFTVRLRDLEDREVEVPRHRTLLDALGDAGVELMYDCRRGECGLCAVRVLACEGQLDHRDVFLSEAQQADGETLLACVSRAVGGTVAIDTGFRAETERTAPRAAAS